MLSATRSSTVYVAQDKGTLSGCGEIISVLKQGWQGVSVLEMRF